MGYTTVGWMLELAETPGEALPPGEGEACSLSKRLFLPFVSTSGDPSPLSPGSLLAGVRAEGGCGSKECEACKGEVELVEAADDEFREAC